MLMYGRPISLPPNVRRDNLIDTISKYDAGTIAKGRAALMAWVAFCERHDLPQYGAPFGPDYCVWFLREEDGHARARASSSLRRTGASVKHDRACSLRWLAAVGCVPFDARESSVRRSAPPDSSREPSMTPTLAIPSPANAIPTPAAVAHASPAGLSAGCQHAAFSATVVPSHDGQHATSHSSAPRDVEGERIAVEVRRLLSCVPDSMLMYGRPISLPPNVRRDNLIDTISKYDAGTIAKGRALDCFPTLWFPCVGNSVLQL